MAKKRTHREQTAMIADRWLQQMALLEPSLLQEATVTIETFLAGTQDQTAYLNNLRTSIRPMWANDCQAEEIAFEVLTLTVSEGMEAEIEQAILRVADDASCQAAEIVALSQRRADLMRTFVPGYLSVLQRVEQGNDEKSLQYLTAYVGYPKAVQDRLKYALRQESSATSKYTQQENLRDQLFSELATPVAVLRRAGSAPLSPANLATMRERAVEDVRSFDPPRPEQGFIPIIDELLVDPTSDPCAIETLRDAQESYQYRFEAFASKLSGHQQQIAEITAQADANNQRLTDQQIAERMRVNAPDVRNQRRRMWTKWNNVSEQSSQKKKST